jgi:uroporphyrin-III C-methyltransferase
MTGKVYLIGAGPGDPDLLTVKGLRLLQAADVVIYDRLIPAALLDEARFDAELIDAGKAPTKHRLSQESINTVIVNRALSGYDVVRLKGGDPFVFGRGGEEALACAAAGIAFEIVPGVSSAFAVPAYAGIPVTHRHVSSAFTVITGHEDPSKPDSSIDYAVLAHLTGTLVILMGVRQLPEISARLIEHGMDPQLPAACVEWGATPQQRVIEGTLATLPDLAAAAEIRPPATIIVGEVVRLRQAGINWYAAYAEALPVIETHHSAAF